MKVLHRIFVFVAFASAVFFACTYEKENPCVEDPGSDACEIFQCALAEDPDACIVDISSDSGNREPSSDSGNYEPSSDSGNYEPSSDSGNPEPSSNSGNPPSSSSQAGTQPSSSSPASTSSSSRSSAATAPSSSSVASTPSSSSVNNNNGGAPSNCAFISSWCGNMEFGDVVKTNQSNGTGVVACIYATAISMLGNSNNANGKIRVNGTEINNCGNTGWGQQACTNTVQSIAKADGGYYIYAPDWYADFTTTGGTPTCNGTTPASSSSRPSSSSAGGIPPQSSSSVAGTPTLTCGTVPSTGTANVPITSRPSVQCNNSTVPGANITWASSPVNINWDNPAANTYTNIRATVNSGTCNGRTATCSGTLTVSAPIVQPSSSSQQSNGGNPPSGYTDGGYTRSGVTTRYWDACKPSCAWTGNAGGSPNGAAKSCSVNGSKLSDANTRNACDSGGSAYTCMDQAPWRINDTWSYGFAASHTNSDCGKCFQIKFGGTISGKIMIVMISNIGGDVGQTQFDLMIPGGGVGQFNALSTQLSQNGGGSNLGATYGGFRATCGNNATCVQNMCNEAFKGSSLANLKAGCDWYVNWFNIADNPSIQVKDVTCPAELIAKYK